MIEQVLYERAESGYHECCSKGLTKEEAHDVNIFMNSIAENIRDLDSGADSPFIIYPFPAMRRICLATFKKEVSGRNDAVNHALLIENTEYRELSKNPSKILGFTNKNFHSTKLNSQGEMVSLKELETSDNDDLDKEVIFRKYKLKNEGYLKFLNAVYTSISKKLNYSYGLRIDNSKNPNRVMRHLGYLLMSMLPYELRDKVSFSSRCVPGKVNSTIVQIIQENDYDRTDIIYDLNTGECTINNPVAEIMDFYLNDLFTMSDAELKEYFRDLESFKENLHLSGDSEKKYVLSKLFGLSKNPSMFESESVDSQLAFMSDVFELPASNMDLINSIVIRLLPYVDVSHYMETFEINFNLYKKLDSNKESDRQMISRIEDNLTQIYREVTNEEKKELFQQLYKSREINMRVAMFVESLVQINDAKLDGLLINEYIDLYENYSIPEYESVLLERIVAVFQRCDISQKERLWNHMYNSKNSNAGNGFMNEILNLNDEPFYKIVFRNLVNIFSASQDNLLKDRAYSCIKSVIDNEDDKYRLQIIQEYNNVPEVESTLWIDTYNAIENKQEIATNKSFIECLREKYYSSSNADICNLYPQYIIYAPESELQKMILDYGKQGSINERDKSLVQKVSKCIIEDEKKVSVSALKTMTRISSIGEDSLARYLRNVYLNTSSDISNQVYVFLEHELPQLYNSQHLAKEQLRSFDLYYSTKLDIKILKNPEELRNCFRYLETFKYHNESFNKIYVFYQQYTQNQISGCEREYDRYRKGEELLKNLDNIKQSKFGSEKYSDLRRYVQRCFWAKCEIAKFDYEHHTIYKSNTPLYYPDAQNYDSYKLAERIGNLFESRYVDWDDVCKLLLTSQDIHDENIRKELLKNFKKNYRSNRMDESDRNFIALNNVSAVSNLTMNYENFFEEMKKYNHRIDDKIRDMSIFKYIQGGDQISKEIDKYREGNKSTKQILANKLTDTQVILLLSLLVINSMKLFMLLIPNEKVKKVVLCVNYGLYSVLAVLVLVVGIILMIKANQEKDYDDDVATYGLLIGNIAVSIVAIFLSVIFKKWFLCLPIAIILPLITINLDLWGEYNTTMIGMLKEVINKKRS